MQYFFIDSSEVPPDFKETARYLGYSALNSPDEVIASLINCCMSEMQAVLRPSLVFERFSCEVDFENETVKIGDTGGFSVKSRALCRNLENCTSVILFGATVGSQVDALIRKYQKIDTVKAGIMQAAGAMFIESFVDVFNEKIKKDCESENKKTRQRFSPGYGNVSLETQKDFFRLLDTKKIGLTLMDSLIMAPEKSVTAFIGIEK